MSKVVFVCLSSLAQKKLSATQVILKCRQMYLLFIISHWNFVNIAARVGIAIEINTIAFDGNNNLFTNYLPKDTQTKWTVNKNKTTKGKKHQKCKRSKQWQWRQPCKTYIITSINCWSLFQYFLLNKRYFICLMHLCQRLDRCWLVCLLIANVCKKLIRSSKFGLNCKLNCSCVDCKKFGWCY